jgi:K+-transporting ATPase ATPase C chain
MRRYAMTSVRMALVTLLLLGAAYPMLVTGLAQGLLPRQAGGSVVVVNGVVIGSELIGQRFASEHYFHPRPSAAGEQGYDPRSSGASNLAPTSRALVERVRSDVASATASNPGLAAGRVPVDMVTASGSGLDPDITRASAYAQVPRVAGARGMTEAEVRRIVDGATSGRQLGFLGEERVNVLRLNLALDVAR